MEKRYIYIMEMDVPPCVNKKIEYHQGMLELTQGYKMLAKENLFDADSKLNKEQVKAVYCKLEKKFAESIQGVVKIPKILLIEGSILTELTIPIFERSDKVKIIYN